MTRGARACGIFALGVRELLRLRGRIAAVTSDAQIAEAVIAGRGMRESRIAEEEAARAEEAAQADAAARLRTAVRPQRREPTPTAAGA